MDIWEPSWAQLLPDRGQGVGSVGDLSPGLCLMCLAAALSLAGLLWSDFPGKSLLLLSLLGKEPRDGSRCWHHLKLTGTEAKEHFQQGGIFEVLFCWHPFLQSIAPACPRALPNPCLPLQAHPKSIPPSSGLRWLQGGCGRGWG